MRTPGRPLGSPGEPKHRHRKGKKEIYASGDFGGGAREALGPRLRPYGLYEFSGAAGEQHRGTMGYGALAAWEGPQGALGALAPEPCANPAHQRARKVRLSREALHGQHHMRQFG